MMISYPVNSQDLKDLSKLLASELMATNDLSYIQDILSDIQISFLNVYDYVNSPKATSQILRNIAQNTNNDVLLAAIARNENTDLETLTYFCSNPEKYYTWDEALSNPKTTRVHALSVMELRKDDTIFSGASAVASSRFFDEEIAEKLFNEYSLEKFDFTILKKRHRKENKEIISDYEVKSNVIKTLLSNDLCPKKWFDIYLVVAKEQNKYDQGNSLYYSMEKNKLYGKLV